GGAAESLSGANSGEMNRSLRRYHHGEIGDIGEVIRHALHTKDYEFIALIGFSMGGNINMKYLGVHGKEVPEAVRACVAFSSPTDLEAGAAILDLPRNFIYKRRFLHYLSLKMQAKQQQFPGKIDLEKLRKIKVWRDFDEHFSAPLNGFQDAADFYRQASAKNFMAGITVPTLLVQAKNDPILPPECFPVEICERHPKAFLEMPRHGGHVGFLQTRSEFAWSERRAFEFVSAVYG
ncbi:MAG: alpha/beta fold hydrolase, partial [Bacteroidota bacterium]